MKKYSEIEFVDIGENTEFVTLIEDVVDLCFKEEGLDATNMYMNIILTEEKNIRNTNKQFRNIDKETDVLSFPMFEKNEIDILIENPQKTIREPLGDIMISIPRIKEQAVEYNHGITRELAYMVVHGFYHVIGYDHMIDEDKKVMREKEENILKKMKIYK